MDEPRWHSRPLRHLTNGELKATIEDRKLAWTQVRGPDARQFISVALDRLEAELSERVKRGMAP